MNLEPYLLPAIDAFLESLPPKTVALGRDYCDRGDVISLEQEEDHLFRAVVRGELNYDVELEFFDEWMGDCTCPEGCDCKHVAAAILKLRAGASKGPKGMLAAANLLKRAAASMGKLRSSGVPQPPPSPLCSRLAAKLGRELRGGEADFVRRVQASFAQARTRSLTEGDMQSLARGEGASWSLQYWQPVELWREFPADDYYFWLHLAWAMGQRGWKYPAFMEEITELALIAPAMQEWEREKQIAQWQDWFREFEGHDAAPDSIRLDLRLMLLPEEARLQWRSNASADFADLKQSLATSFATQFENGALTLTPEAVPIWGATYKPWGHESWWHFKYSNDLARPALNRLLRIPLPLDRVVGPDGQAIQRASEPLRFRLTPPSNGEGNYELALVTANDSPPPRIFCALSGRPALYLTEGGLFPGPSPDALEDDSSKSIPAAALESSEGLRFLHALEIPLPEHMARRIRTEPVRVTISCELQPSYPGSKTEDILLRATAKAPGMKTEKLAAEGWDAARAGASKPNAKGIITLHDRAAQRHFPRLFDELGAKIDGYRGVWKLRLTRKTPEIFLPWLNSLPPEIEVNLDPELATLRDEPLSGTVSLDISEADIDWFDLKVALKVSDTTLTAEELKLLLNARGGYVRLGKKGWRRLKFDVTPEEDEQLARLGLNPRDFSAEPQRFHALQLADEAARRFLGPDRIERIQRRVSELKTRVSPPLPAVIRAEMRPYQTEGFHFLAYLTSNRFGGVLADDMGLGKTLQALAWLAWLRENAEADHQGETPQNGEGGAPKAGLPHPSLVVCPKSVMDNWRAEAGRFYPDLRVRMWRGEPAAELAAAVESADLIVINYAQLRSLSPDLANVQWQAAILDEAQCVKNPDSQSAQCARSLKAHHRIALTGTPIENRLLDLWSILAYAMPGALGNRTFFLRRFNSQDDPLARRRLAARVRPFLLRRTKGQVAKDLPDRVEEDLLCEMEGEQATLYQAELKRARQIILGVKTHQQLNQERFNILTSLLRLRQICCHPALVDNGLRQAQSAKLTALEDLLEPLMEEGHKVLVFSQFVTMLDLLRQKVDERKWPKFYLAGDTENRGELIQKFQSAEGGAVFLISLKAGGFGLNLTAASYVVLFDPWWNPAVESQAIDRTHRIGQTSKVMAYRLLIRDSIEQKMRALQKQKAALAEDVLGEERFAQSLTLDDLRFLFAE